VYAARQGSQPGIPRTPVTRSLRAVTVGEHNPTMHGRRRSHRQNDEFCESMGEPPPKQLTTSTWESSRSLDDAFRRVGENGNKSYHVEP
jgi:hypothetical protein